jgi:hypothetical protein
MIEKQETETNEKYDIYIFATFRDIILDFPKENGTYTTPYMAFMKKRSYGTILPAIEIVSDEFVRLDGVKSISMYDLPILILQNLLHILFGDKVFLPTHNMVKRKHKITKCIPSVIKTSENPFDYTTQRSIFSWEERFQQTLKQVKSIYDKCDDVVSYILEGSRVNLRYLNELSKYSNVVLFATDINADYYANTHLNKSIYEIYCMGYMISKIDSDWIFKFGGRYNLHDSFDINIFLHDIPAFKVIPPNLTFANKSIIECIIYSIPRDYFSIYERIFSQMKDEIVQGSKNAIETLLLKYSPKYKNIPKLNVIGRDAVYGFENFV